MNDGKSDGRPTAVLTNWMPIKIGTEMHLVGVVDGHTRLPAGHWMITSPISEWDPLLGTARTSSSGRRYALVDQWLPEPLGH
jgi:hypothetical protein